MFHAKQIHKAENKHSKRPQEMKQITKYTKY